MADPRKSRRRARGPLAPTRGGTLNEWMLAQLATREPIMTAAQGPSNGIARRRSGAPVRIARLNFVAIDFETASYRADSACAVGLVKVANGEIVDTAVHLIRPPTRAFAFTHIHGLTWSDVAESDDFGKLWPRLEPFLDGAAFLAAHNASFDRRVLHACCQTYGIAAPALPFRCTVQISRRAWNIYPTKLSDVCRELAIALNHHEALSDAMACAQIVLAAQDD
jgi:DNA polymerase-3 subunit epsilon